MSTLDYLEIAYQSFERGYMFWLRPVDQIWVLFKDRNGDDSGTWRIYDEKIEPERFTMPATNLPQCEGLMRPISGFARLWESDAGLRQALGCGTMPETCVYGVNSLSPNVISPMTSDCPNAPDPNAGPMPVNYEYYPETGVQILYDPNGQPFQLFQNGRWNRGHPDP
jgi:hypothetical protein